MVSTSNGYHADNARAFFLGPARDLPDRARRAHEFCREALTRITERLRPGALASEVWREVSDWAVRSGEPQGFMGYGDNRVRFFGHGVGLELDELPVLAERADVELREGMLLAVEPKAFLEGIGPVGLENTYVVTDAGCESLCAAVEDLVAVS
jgi:Xaa-Pro aminopeptidase